MRGSTIWKSQHIPNFPSLSIPHLTSRGSPRQLRIEECAAVRKASKAAVHVTQGEAVTAGGGDQMSSTTWLPNLVMTNIAMENGILMGY